MSRKIRKELSAEEMEFLKSIIVTMLRSNCLSINGIGMHVSCLGDTTYDFNKLYIGLIYLAVNQLYDDGKIKTLPKMLGEESDELFYCKDEGFEVTAIFSLPSKKVLFKFDDKPFYLDRENKVLQLPSGIKIAKVCDIFSKKYPELMTHENPGYEYLSEFGIGDALLLTKDALKGTNLARPSYIIQDGDTFTFVERKKESNKELEESSMNLTEFSKEAFVDRLNKMDEEMLKLSTAISEMNNNMQNMKAEIERMNEQGVKANFT